ncbi:MAG: outer membrane protein assembly factor BamE [Alphaproteobacteria bacterium]|nr:outer membrane protein assembly factor BamE [Alphaproteobacteria bacterium]
MHFRLPAIIPLFFTLSACSAMIDVHGDAVDPEVLASFKPNETLYMEVQQKLGSPSSKVLFESEEWVYIHSKQKRIAFLKPKETERTVIVFKFNRDGVLQNVEKKTLEQGRAFSPSPASSQEAEESLTILDQMISNVGRMNTETPVH